MYWQGDEIETLKRLWDDGFSASQIANEMRGRSRNSVLGQVHRMGLAKRHTFTRVENKAWAEAKAGGDVVVYEPRRHPRTSKRSAIPRPIYQNRKEAVKKHRHDMGMAERFALANIERGRVNWRAFDLRCNAVSLLDVGPCMCRWPLGETKDLWCCGNPVSNQGPYCSEHRALAFQ
jgi:GcrA cell cycle regulator